MNCAFCDQPAVGACSYCNRFSCAGHGAVSDQFGPFQEKWLCAECYQRVERRSAIAKPLMIGAAILALLIPVAILFSMQ